MDVDSESLLGRFGQLPDPRRRAGRRYPLPALLGMLVLGALHGESSLRGIWLWAHANWSSIWQPLGFRSPHFPALTTIWNLLGALDATALDQVIATWVTDLFGPTHSGLSADGKVLRGSRRAETAPIWLVSLARHDVGAVLRQRQVPVGGHELATLLALLRETPLHQQVITLDAGLLCAETTQVIRAQQGEYLGVVKGNQADIKAALDDWLTDSAFSPRGPAASGNDLREITRTDRNSGAVAGARR